MRVTNSLMANNYLRNLNRQTSKVQKSQDQLSSLKEVSKPSDNPLAVSKIMDLNNSIVQNENFLTNIGDAIDWTNVQDVALSQASNSLGKVHTLIQSAANGTMSHEDRQAVKSNIEAEMGVLVVALNTNFGGRYVFAGQNTTETPFEIEKAENGNLAGIKYTGNNKNLPREVSSGVTVDLLTDGNRLAGGDRLGAFFSEVFIALDEDDIDALGGDLLEKSDQVIDNTLNMRVEIGATFNRLEAAKDRNETENINLYSIRSNIEDVDLAEKYMQYSMEMVAYEASLQMGTRILQTNILNYL